MKAAKWIIALLIGGVAAYFILQELQPTKMNTNQSAEASNMKKSYYSDGTIKAQVKIIEGKKEGKGYNYYPDGSVHSEINYKNNIKQGNSVWYFENGKPYRITPYKDGRRHGIQKKYYESGELLAEIPYKNGKLLPGTKEYEKSGKLVTDNPKIITKDWDNSLLKGTYDIDLSLNTDNKVEFQVVDVKNNMEYLTKPTNAGNYRVSFVSIPGVIELKEILITAKFRTDLGNYKIIRANHKFVTGQE